MRAPIPELAASRSLHARKLSRTAKFSIYLKCQHSPTHGRACPGRPFMNDMAISSDGIAPPLCLSSRELHSARKNFIEKVAMDTSDSRLHIPPPQGLYHSRYEHDACGMGLVASIRGEKSHDIIRKGLEVLINLTHRGAAGCDPRRATARVSSFRFPMCFSRGNAASWACSCPNRVPMAWPWCFCPWTNTAGCSARASASASPRKKD